MSGKGRGRGRGKQAPGAAAQKNGAPGDSSPPSSQETGVTTSMARLELSKPSTNTTMMTRVVDRPGYGKNGRPINLFSNYFTLTLAGERGLVVQQYRVEFPECKRKLDKDDMREIFWRVVKEFQTTVFTRPTGMLFDDSAILYSLDKIPLENGVNTFEINMEMDRDNRPNLYLMRLQYTGQQLVDLTEKSLSDSELYAVAGQVIDMVTSQLMRCPAFDFSKLWYPWGRSLFKAPAMQAPRLSLGGGVEMWTGISLACRIGENWKPLINADVAHSTFYKVSMPLVEFVAETLNKRFPPRGRNAPPNYTAQTLANSRGLGPEEHGAIDKALSRTGIKLKTTHMKQNRCYKFTSLSKDTPRNKRFTMIDRDTGAEHEISVEDYFRQKYNYDQLGFPNMPLVQVGPRLKQIFLPMEVLNLHDKPQKMKKQLDAAQKADMIRNCAKPAVERKKAIENLLLESRPPNGEDPFMNAFGVSINSEMLKLTGRVLDAPKIKLRQRELLPRDGQWRLEGGFLTPAPLTIEYGLISFISQQEQEMLVAMCKNFQLGCSNLGMQFASQFPSQVQYINKVDGIESAVQHIRSKGPINLILFIMWDKKKDIYAEIKRVCDVEEGVASQVLLKRNVCAMAEKGPNGATVQNVALKVNMKLGGVNSGVGKNVSGQDAAKWAIHANPSSPTLFMGLDVTHPPPSDHNGLPSIAAVVSNVDVNATTYAASVKIQHKKKESIIYVQDTVKERIHQYFQKTKFKPARIIVYRDGVSESQFDEVLQEEMESIRGACLQLSSDYKPAITYIIVQKRHHTRFFPGQPNNRQDAVGRAGNVPPGTVVDRAVTHPSKFDFYLCSHFGALGTSRPTRYFVIHDDSGFDADHLQAVTYDLCHVYGRCPKAVSLPAPVYYAHLCAARAQYHVTGLIGSSSGSGTRRSVTDTSTGAAQSSGSDAELQRAATIHDNLKFLSYFG